MILNESEWFSMSLFTSSFVCPFEFQTFFFAMRIGSFEGFEPFRFIFELVHQFGTEPPIQKVNSRPKPTREVLARHLSLTLERKSFIGRKRLLTFELSVFFRAFVRQLTYVSSILINLLGKNKLRPNCFGRYTQKPNTNKPNSKRSFVGLSANRVFCHSVF